MNEVNTEGLLSAAAGAAGAVHPRYSNSLQLDQWQTIFPGKNILSMTVLDLPLRGAKKHRATFSWCYLM